MGLNMTDGVTHPGLNDQAICHGASLFNRLIRWNLNEVLLVCCFYPIYAGLQQTINSLRQQLATEQQLRVAKEQQVSQLREEVQHLRQLLAVAELEAVHIRDL